MKLIRFRLSGVDHTGDEAMRMYETALSHGFQRIGADLNPWSVARPHGDPERFVVDADVSGVSAWCEIAFDNVADAIAWIAAHPLVEPQEPAATEAYRAILSQVMA